MTSKTAPPASREPTPGRRDRHTGSLRRRSGSAIWQAGYYHHGELVEETTGTADLAKAKRYLRERLRTAGTTTFITPNQTKILFEDLADLARADHTKQYGDC